MTAGNEGITSEIESSFDWAEIIQKVWFRGKLLLRRFWWVLLTTLAAGTAFQAWQEFQKDPIYISNARMVVLGAVRLPGSGVYIEEFSNFFGTQIEIIQSSEVRQSAAARVRALNPDLPPTGVSISVSRQSNTSIFLLRAEGREPEYTRAFLDAVMDEYLALRKRTRESTQNVASNAVTEQLISIEDRIDQEEQLLVEFQRENNMVFVERQGSSAGERLAEANDRLASLQSEYDALRNIDLARAPLETMRGQGTQVRSALSSLPSGDELFDTVADLKAAQSSQREFALYLRPRHPKMIAFRDELERLQSVFDIQLNAIRSERESRLAMLADLIDNQREAIAEWEVRALDFSRRMAEFQRLQSRLERSNALYEQLIATIQNIDVSQQLGQETISVMERAGSAREISGSVPREAIKGAIMGLALGVAGLAVIGLIDNRVFSADDLKRRFDLQVLGIIPLQTRDDEDRVALLEHRDSRHLFAESCRTLRSSLLFMDHFGEHPQSMIVSSSVPSEGKSTIASNLAVTFAFASSRTLLVDADLRRGHLHKELHTGRTGLSEYLSNEITLEQAIQTTAVENLDFLACGEYPDRPGELLLSKRMLEMMEELKQRYDFIVYDTAPILATDDTPSFVSRADGILFCVRSGLTQTRQVQSALDRVRMRRARILGFVLNFVDTTGSDYYYYSKYNNYYAYGPQNPIEAPSIKSKS